MLGRITAENAEPLAGANVWLEPLKIGAQTGPDGRFEIRDLPQGPIKVTVSYIGFAPRTESLSLKTDEIIEIDWVLHSQSQLLSDVIVSATRAGNATPMAPTNLNPEQLSRNNLGQDVPFLLQWTPSAVVTSDAGTGIGYTGIRIRGSDPTRINVTINGIPLNDAESQGVYWVDLPDFLSSTSDVQIQRGAGTSTNGAGAFGASIHLNTATPSTDPYAIIAASAGSFDTYKGSVSFGSGRLGAGFSLDGRYSMIRSNGYIDRASADLQSYYISGAYTGEQQSLRLNVFSGHERTYQAWNGVPVQYVNDPVLRTYNTAGLEKPGEPYENEVDDYTQTHYQALYFRDLGQDWRANVNLHYTRGKGYYEQYKAAESPADYGLAPVNAGGEMLTSADLVRRLWLDNHFYGLTYGLFY